LAAAGVGHGILRLIAGNRTVNPAWTTESSSQLN
jgi:hypothetical protein